MKVHWTDNAVAHLLDIYEYIAYDSPIYAKRMVDRMPLLLISITLVTLHFRHFTLPASFC